ncbi:hypothetical protein BDW67DRAFT_178697 [Aspergillus spinulosporus]
MIDPLSAAGLAYPIAKDLYRCAKRLRKAYREIRHAKESLRKVIDKVEIVAETYVVFRDTMAGAKKIKYLAQTFEKHSNLIGKVKSESRQIIKRLEAITDIFSPLLGDDLSDPVQRWITQFQWYRKEKSAVAPFLIEMQILQGSMDLIATLINTQILQHSDRWARSGQDLLQMQIKSTEISFKKLQEDKRNQEEILRQRSSTAKQDKSAARFAEDIIRILEKEIPKLYRAQLPDSPSTPDPGSSSTSSAPPQQAPRSTPPLLSRPDAGGQESSPRSHHTVLVIDGSEQEGMEEAPPQKGPYVRMPPFGSPEAGPRPRPGRNSLTHLSPSSGRDDRPAENRVPPRSNGNSGKRNGIIYSGDKRRTGSRISVYGNEGEVTPTHLMGSAGLPSGWQRRREEL